MDTELINNDGIKDTDISYSDTEISKPKNGMRHSPFLRFLAIIISLIGAALVFSSVFRIDNIGRSFGTEDFLKSDTYLSQRERGLGQINDVYSNYISEEDIKSGNFLNYEIINNYSQKIKEQYNTEIQNIYESYRQLLKSDVSTNNPDETVRLTKERDALIKAKQAKSDKEVANVKDHLIAARLKQFEGAKKSLSENKNIIYSVYIDKSLIYGPGASTYGSTYATMTGSHSYRNQIENSTKEIEIYLSLTPEAYNLMKAKYNSDRADGLIGLYYLLGGCLLCLIGLIWLIYAAGELTFFDKIYLDVAAVGIVSIYALYAFLISNIGGNLIREYVPTQAYILGGLFALLYLLTPWFLVSATKRLKRREFLKHTLVVSILLFCIRKFQKTGNNLIKPLLDSDKLNRAVIAHFGVFIGCCIVLGMFTILIMISINPFFGFFVGLLIFIGLCAYFAKMIIGKLKSIETLADGVKAIKSGDLAQKIPMTGVALVDNISGDVNNLADGLKIALQNEIKAEHMKVDLVTNVSHDLKTPLTSIINYVDLLSKENLTPEKANEYVTILQKKSERLKHLVEDLFEVSIANSGSVTIKLEPLSLNELLGQAVGEYEDKFKEKKLDIRLNTDAKVMINGDSSRMWRVLSNLFDNVIKYSMDSTRVYIDCNQDDKFGWIAIKNISSYEMNFPAEEITERFKQGDESRSGEGSGLGLAIVKSFMKLQGGSCEITVDGDLFKVLMKVPLV